MEHRNVFEKIYDEIKYLAKLVTAGSKEARALEAVKHTFEKVYREGTANTNTDVKAQYSLSIKHTDGTVEEIADARDLTTEQAISYLEQAKSGKLKWDTYIPVRKDTPQVVIDTLAAANVEIENRSLLMQVRKAQQAMSANNKGNRKRGNNVRGHALSPAEVAEIVNKIDDTSLIILQTNRTNDQGQPLPDTVAVFVEYGHGGESVAVIEFESSINPEFIGADYGDTAYHTVVTVFEPDTMRDGMPFDYAEELLSNPDNVELEIKREHPARSAIGKKHPNTSSEPLSTDSIPQPDPKVNPKNSLSPTDEDLAPVGDFATPANELRYEGDIALAREDVQTSEQGVAVSFQYNKIS